MTPHKGSIAARPNGHIARLINHFVDNPALYKDWRAVLAYTDDTERALSEAQQEIETARDEFHRIAALRSDEIVAHQRERDALRAALKAGVGTHGEVCHNPECEFLVQARAALGEADQETHHD